MELLKDYDCDLLYHPGRANRVANALSRKSSIAHLLVKGWILLEGARDSEFKFEVGHLSSLMATLRIEPEMQAKIKALQSTDFEIHKILEMDGTKKKLDFQVSEDGILNSKYDYAYLRMWNLRKRFWWKLIGVVIVFIQTVRECIRICSDLIGGVI